MPSFVARILLTAFGLWIADALLAGVSVRDVGTLWLAALLIAVVNAVVRPIVVVFTLPITFLTLGLFIFVVNGAMFLLVASWLDAFEITGLGPAVLASMVVGAVNWMLGGAMGKTKKGQSAQGRQD